MFERDDPAEPHVLGSTYDGTTTLFLGFKGCNEDELWRHLNVIGIRDAKIAGYTEVACDDQSAAIAIP